MENETENQFTFTVYSDKSEYDKILTEIRQIAKDLPPEEIIRQIQNKFSLGIILGSSLKRENLEMFKFYRARAVDPGESIDETSISQFYYNPTPKLGRANLEGQPVFYASADKNTPFHELKNQILPQKTIVYLSVWSISGQPDTVYMRNLFLGIPEGKDRSYASIMASGISAKYEQTFSEMSGDLRENFIYGQKKYNEIFTTEGNDYYHVSSAIAYNTLISALKQGVDLPILSYPSVAKEKDSVNFAIRKDFADKYLRLDEVHKVVVKQLNDNSVTFYPISRGLVKNGRVEWKDYDIKITKVHYDLAQITHDPTEPPQGLFKLNKEEPALACCAKHSYSVQQYLEGKGINKLLPEIIRREQINIDYDHLPTTLNYMVVIPTEKIYLRDNISDSGKITYIGVPVSYTAGYN
jgi:hypothetical protein